jgi:hypothetical protein
VRNGPDRTISFDHHAQDRNLLFQLSIRISQALTAKGFTPELRQNRSPNQNSG